MVDKSILGKRRQCSDCPTKFYDLSKPNPTCPKCGGKPKPPFKVKHMPIVIAPVENDELDESGEDLDATDDEMLLPMTEMETEFSI